MENEKQIPDTLDYLTEMVEVEGEMKPRWEALHFIMTLDVIVAAMKKFYKDAPTAYPNLSREKIERMGDERVLDLILTPTERGTTLMAHIPAYECEHLSENLKRPKSVKKLLAASIQLPTKEGAKKVMAFAQFLCKTSILKRLSEQDIMDVLTAPYYPNDVKKSAAVLHISEPELPVLFEMLSVESLNKLDNINSKNGKSMKDVMIEVIGNYAGHLRKDAKETVVRAVPYRQAARILSQRAKETRKRATQLAAKLRQVNTR